MSYYTALEVHTSFQDISVQLPYNLYYHDKITDNALFDINAESQTGFAELH
ncbi:hypothetical protein IMSAG025_02258 [Muribaculaceae bacterium]|nr:hypothetical protein IMSAG025_02258 [Muribaculaceae bacterium]